MEGLGSVKGKQKKKMKVSSIVKNKSSMEEVVLQILPKLEDTDSSGFLIAEEDIRKSEEAAAKEEKHKKQQLGNGRSASLNNFIIYNRFLFRNADYFEKDGKRCGYHKLDSETRTKLEIIDEEAKKTFNWDII